MRNSYVDIRRNGPDTSELDAGWDLEPSRQPSAVDVFDSLRPSYASLRPNPAALRESVLRESATRTNPRTRLVAALSVSVLVVGGALATTAFERAKSRAASAPSAAALIQAELPPPLEVATASPTRSDALAAEPGEARAEAETQPAEAAEARRVLLQVEPAGATVFVDGQRIGSDLVNVELHPHSVERATIKRPGYRTRVVEIDGSVNFVHVRLASIPRAPRVPKAEPAADKIAVPSEPSNGDQSKTSSGTAVGEPSNGDQSKTSSEVDAAYPE